MDILKEATAGNPECVRQVAAGADGRNQGGHTIVEPVEGLPGELHLTFAEALRDEGGGVRPR